MLIYRANSSSPAAPVKYPYKPWPGSGSSISGKDLACGLYIGPDGVLKSPANLIGPGDYQSDRRLFCAAMWNNMAHLTDYATAYTFGGINIPHGGGGYQWKASKNEWLKAYGPSQMTQNSKCILYVNPGPDAINNTAQYSTIQGYSAVTPTIKAGEMLVHPDTSNYYKGYYNENVDTGWKLTCLSLAMNYLGVNQAMLLCVNYALNVFIASNPVFLPTDSNFDIKMVSVYNTRESNKLNWGVQTEGRYDVANNTTCVRDLSGYSVEYKVFNDGVLMMYRGYALYLYPCYLESGYNPIMFPLPALRLGTHITLGNAPTLDITCRGFAMVVEGDQVTVE